MALSVRNSTITNRRPRDGAKMHARVPGVVLPAQESCGNWKTNFLNVFPLVTFPYTACDSNISATSVTVRDIQCSYHATDERMKYKSKLTVMDSSQRNSLRTGSTVPDSGIYRVSHSPHRLPKEVTLWKDQAFPRCSRCSDPVFYELVRSAPAVSAPRGFAVMLYELPEITDESLAG